jgi:hypothetical protein
VYFSSVLYSEVQVMIEQLVTLSRIKFLDADASAFVQARSNAARKGFSAWCVMSEAVAMRYSRIVFIRHVPVVIHAG